MNSITYTIEGSFYNLFHAWIIFVERLLSNQQLSFSYLVILALNCWKPDLSCLIVLLITCIVMKYFISIHNVVKIVRTSDLSFLIYPFNHLHCHEVQYLTNFREKLGLWKLKATLFWIWPNCGLHMEYG